MDHGHTRRVESGNPLVLGPEPTQSSALLFVCGDSKSLLPVYVPGAVSPRREVKSRAPRLTPLMSVGAWDWPRVAGAGALTPWVMREGAFWVRPVTCGPSDRISCERSPCSKLSLPASFHSSPRGTEGLYHPGVYFWLGSGGPDLHQNRLSASSDTSWTSLSFF